MNAKKRAILADALPALTRSTSEFGRCRIWRDAFLSGFSPRELARYAEHVGKPLSEAREDQKRARARLRAGAHQLAVAPAVTSSR
jgi:hypothetical protein